MISKVPLSVKRCSDAPPTVPRWPVDGGAVHRWGQPCWHISQMPQLVDLKQTVRYTEVASRTTAEYVDRTAARGSRSMHTTNTRGAPHDDVCYRPAGRSTRMCDSSSCRRRSSSLSRRLLFRCTDSARDHLM